MKKIRLLLCITTAMGLLALPFWQGSDAVLAAEGLDQPLKEGGAAQPSKIHSKASVPAKDDSVASNSRDYAQAVAALSAKLASIDDPAERERLQLEIHALKLEEEIAVKETMLLVATERKEKEKIEELEDALEQLYHPLKTQPADDGAVQASGGGALSTAARQKQPDDAPEGGQP